MRGHPYSSRDASVALLLRHCGPPAAKQGSFHYPSWKPIEASSPKYLCCYSEEDRRRHVGLPRPPDERFGPFCVASYPRETQEKLEPFSGPLMVLGLQCWVPVHPPNAEKGCGSPRWVLWCPAWVTGPPQSFEERCVPLRVVWELMGLEADMEPQRLSPEQLPNSPSFAVSSPHHSCSSSSSLLRQIEGP
jgi:hypothetical protein